MHVFKGPLCLLLSELYSLATSLLVICVYMYALITFNVSYRQLSGPNVINYTVCFLKMQTLQMDLGRWDFKPAEFF